jgi:hypothetical protein
VGNEINPIGPVLKDPIPATTVRSGYGNGGEGVKKCVPKTSVPEMIRKREIPAAPEPDISRLIMPMNGSPDPAAFHD